MRKSDFGSCARRQTAVIRIGHEHAGTLRIWRRRALGRLLVAVPVPDRLAAQRWSGGPQAECGVVGAPVSVGRATIAWLHRRRSNRLDETITFRVRRRNITSVRILSLGGDGHRGAVHVEFLLAIEPRPSVVKVHVNKHVHTHTHTHVQNNPRTDRAHQAKTTSPTGMSAGTVKSNVCPAGSIPSLRCGQFPSYDAAT